MKKFLHFKKRFFRHLYIAKLNLFLKNTVINPEVMNNFDYNNVIVFAPHCDDEVIGCAGLLLKIKKFNPSVNINIFFLDDFNDVRKNEARLVAEKAGFNIITDWKRYITKSDLILVPSLIENHKSHVRLFISITNFLIKQKYNTSLFLYNIWSFSFPNIVVDISDVIEEKSELLSFYKSQLESKDYLHITRGLNAYYSIYLKNNVSNNQEKNISKKSYAEIFYKTNINKLPFLLK